MNKSPKNMERPLKYVCTEADCNARFKRIDALDLHVFKHTGVKKYACLSLNCNKSYRTITHLKRHMKTTHEEVQPRNKEYACEAPNCEKKFTSTTNLQRHIREVHENPKVYTCTDCSEVFTQKLKLRRHTIKAHTNVYPFNCEKCGKGLYLQNLYERHVSSCKIYPCPDCSEVFNKWTLYLKHCKLLEHGRRRHECEHCHKLYKKPSELKEHIAVVHAANDSDVMLYKCTFENCERAYAYERNLKQHIRTSHEGKRYKCEVENCAKEFKSANNLEKHKRDMHEEKRTKTANDKKKPAKTARKRRADADGQNISYLAKISNLQTNSQLRKLLIQRDEEALEISAKELRVELFTGNTKPIPT